MNHYKRGTVLSVISPQLALRKEPYLTCFVFLISRSLTAAVSSHYWNTWIKQNYFFNCFSGSMIFQQWGYFLIIHFFFIIITQAVSSKTQSDADPKCNATLNQTLYSIQKCRLFLFHYLCKRMFHLNFFQDNLFLWCCIKHQNSQNWLSYLKMAMPIKVLVKFL